MSALNKKSGIRKSFRFLISSFFFQCFRRLLFLSIIFSHDKISKKFLLKPRAAAITFTEFLNGHIRGKINTSRPYSSIKTFLKSIY